MPHPFWRLRWLRLALLVLFAVASVEGGSSCEAQLPPPSTEVEDPAGSPSIQPAGAPGAPAFVSLAVVLVVFFGLIWLRGVPIELLFLSGLAVVTLLGVIKPAEAVSGFANSAVLM